MTDHRLTHIGLCVEDVDQAIDFYCNALGFEQVGRMLVTGSQTERLLDLSGIELDLVYLQRDGFRIELLNFISPTVVPASPGTAMNTRGFTHLSFRCDDVEVLAAKIEAHGGTVLHDRTVAFETGNKGLIGLDPEGTWIELIERVAPR